MKSEIIYRPNSWEYWSMVTYAPILLNSKYITVTRPKSGKKVRIALSKIHRINRLK